MYQTIKAGKLQLQINEDANRIRWSAEGLPLRNEELADLWRVHLDDGYYRSMTVRSSRQKGCVSAAENGWVIRYSQLTGDDGRVFDIAFTVHITVATHTYPSLEMWAEVDNHSAARLNELQLPFIDLSVIGCEQRAQDILYKMNGLGEKILNPWEALKKSHTEYMAADYDEIWDTVQYPCAAGMCWFGVESGEHFLYVGRHDNQFRTATLATGLAPRHASPRLILSVSNYLLVKKGETLTSAHSVVSLNKGGWKTGSDIYGSWARSDWYFVPQKPEWVQNMTGWQRIILRHQYGEVFFRYKDLPHIYQEGKRYGLDTLMVFGWWKGRFDNGYPVYEADPELGGEEALRKAIEEIHAMGGHMALYTNGILIDIATDYYKTTGYKISKKDLDHNEYRDHYQFSNNGMLLRSFGYKSFVTACPATPEWRAQLLHNAKVKLAFQPDSIFFDQMGGHKPVLCFDETHQHGSRGDAEPAWRIRNMDAIRALCGPEQAFGTEQTVDAFAPHIDYHHGCQYGNIFGETAFPELFLRTFPEPIMTDRFLHDNRADFKRLLNYAFVYGFRFDVSVYRGRKSIISDLPDYAAYIKKLTDTKEQYRAFFYQGRFVCNHTLPLPAGVRMTEYENPEGQTLLVFWNDSGAPVEFTAGGRPVRLAPQEVDCLVWKED